jgi:hypothetical protein
MTRPRTSARRARTRSLCVALLALLALGARPALADVPISAEARTHFKAGVKLLQDPGGARYEDAYLQFKAAYAASPSARILGNLGLCAMKLERDREAIEAFEKFLSDVPDLAPAEREQVKGDLVTLKTGLVRVEVRVNVAGATLVDVRTPALGVPVSNTYGPVQGAIELGLRPGRHTITIKAPSHEPATWELDAPPGSSHARAIELRKPAPAPVVRTAPAVERIRPIPTRVFVVGGASLGLAVGGAVTGVLALGKRAEFDRANDGRTPTRAQSLKTTGQALDITTDVLFATALVGAGVTTYLYLTRPTLSVTREAAPWLRFDAGGSPAGPRVGVTGVF